MVLLLYGCCSWLLNLVNPLDFVVRLTNSSWLPEKRSRRVDLGMDVYRTLSLQYRPAHKKRTFKKMSLKYQRKLRNGRASASAAT